jgi:integrase
LLAFLRSSAIPRAKPYLIKALTEKATIDLGTFVENAQRKIGSAISDLRHNQDGVRVAAEITAIRLADIAFDSKTLRVIAEAEGTISMYITALPGL